MDLFPENEPDLRTRDLYERAEPIPELRIRELTGDVQSLSKRSSSSSSSDSSNGSSASQSSGGSNLTPIVIGVVVPVLIIAIILFVVWRRRSKITKHEESHDKYRSLDFGVDPAVTQETKRRKLPKGGPEMSVSDLKDSLRRNKGVSMDLGMTNPYLLPPEVQQSRESLHSLSRSITGDDKYRATTFVPDDGSIRSPSSLRSGHDSSSIFTGSTKRYDTESKTDLLPRVPTKDTHEKSGGLLPPKFQDHDRMSTLSNTSGVAAIRASNNYLAQYISGGDKKQESKRQSLIDTQPGLIVTETEVNPSPTIEEPRQPPVAAVRNAPPQRSSSYYDQPPMAELADTDPPSKQISAIPQIETSYHDSDTSSSLNPMAEPQTRQSANPHALQTPGGSRATSISNAPQRSEQSYMDDVDDDYYDEEGYGEYEDYIDYTYRGSMIGVRPLPPDDPTENPEQRANRIRSFYKEYFDDGSGGSKNGSRPTGYYDGSEQYEDNVDAYYSSTYSRGPSTYSDGRSRAMSHGNHMYRGGPRAFSSMSGRMGPPRRGPPKKNLPPPKPLMLLPTPHKLKDDDFLPNAIDFAPPQVFKNQRAGTPDSLRGGLRPYSPSVRPHVPLTSSFDDLAVIPSPHSLRKSGTFTALEFAPPRRFKENGDSMSETGSIRSNRSNLSRMHLANIRNGAYRVSRIPKEVAGTKDDMYAALRPKWDMRGDSAVPGR